MWKYCSSTCCLSPASDAPRFLSPLSQHLSAVPFLLVSSVAVLVRAAANHHWIHCLQTGICFLWGCVQSQFGLWLCSLSELRGPWWLYGRWLHSWLSHELINWKLATAKDSYQRAAIVSYSGDILPHIRLEDILQVTPLMSILSPYHLDAMPKVVPQYLCNALSLALTLSLPPSSSLFLSLSVQISYGPPFKTTIPSCWLIRFGHLW